MAVTGCPGGCAQPYSDEKIKGQTCTFPLRTHEEEAVLCRTRATYQKKRARDGKL